MIFFTPSNQQNSGGVSLTFDPTTKTVGTTTAMTRILNSSLDDHFTNVVIPFNVNFLGGTFNRVYIGSNSYATFGGGSTAYSGISASNPPYRGIHISAADNSYQRIYTISETSGLGPSFRVRYEGTASVTGTLGSPNMLWELIFYQNSPGIVDVVMGLNARGAGGVSGVTNGYIYLYTPPAMTSYRITTTVTA